MAVALESSNRAVVILISGLINLLIMSLKWFIRFGFSQHVMLSSEKPNTPLRLTLGYHQ